MRKTMDELLQTPYWIVDILPEQVPGDSPGQYFAVEEYFLEKSRIKEIKQKHINVVLKLNCYISISLDEENAVNPSPERIAEGMCGRHLCIMAGEAMIVSEPDETYLTVYNPDGRLLELLQAVSAAEGLFVWQPQGKQETE